MDDVGLAASAHVAFVAVGLGQLVVDMDALRGELDAEDRLVRRGAGEDAEEEEDGEEDDNGDVSCGDVLPVAPRECEGAGHGRVYRLTPAPGGRGSLASRR